MRVAPKFAAISLIMVVVIGGCTASSQSGQNRAASAISTSFLQSPTTEGFTLPPSPTPTNSTTPAHAASRRSASTSSTRRPPAATCSASVKYAHLAGGTQTVYVRSNQYNKAVDLTIHYKTKDSYYSGNTDGSGRAAISFGVGRPTKGYEVVVDIDAGSAACSTSWTPE
jgi:hypothetical protein